jgi:UDP-glucose:(heptosyl)LPS alpha-1,3-glucosyltransferase
MAHLSGILINFLVPSLRYFRDSCVEHGTRIGGPDFFRALRLLVVGSDDSVFFRPVILELRMQDRLRFEAPPSDVLFSYAAADLYVSPSLEDPFGLPILEAMACGLPVIASSHAGASDMIHDGETGFILRDPQDQLELARLICRIYEEKTLRLAMGEAASQHVLANCGWDENAEKSREFLESTRQRLSKN